MTVFLGCLVLFLGLAGHSDGAYCVCNNGVSDSVLQKNIDYACANGADCTAIQQNGPCFNPNTVRDHCNYAVNSYYQRKGQVAGSCDFQGSATVTSNGPNAASGCVYQSSPSTGGASTPLSSPTTPNAGGLVPGSTTNPGFALGPTGSGGFGNTNSGSIHLVSKGSTLVLLVLSVTLLVSGLICPRI